MLTSPSFTLTEQFALGSMYSWRLKESEIRFHGTGRYEHLVMRRIPASDEQIASFVAALDLLQVWDWRNDYHPRDVGFETLDGSSWTFSASLGSRTCSSGGENGCPCFSAPRQTTLGRGRFSLLIAALYDCFQIEAYIHQAKQFRELEQKNANQVAEADRGFSKGLST